ncbi:hypothetical protein M408DRAFT_25168 [Serendipita vermifera MAFF 305830]|uniref:TOG domain-containing protein n=1 Tax=Serendipita vermifera MAFF 305830 TaxID=933852 RepID=A0A0C2WK25_SERVB|nr:hypothetical protein M408DRAFT_25168 [Serendipita vermifera MAFF 305830]
MEKEQKFTSAGQMIQPKLSDPIVKNVHGPPIGVIAEEERIPGMVREYTGWDVYNNEARKVDIEFVKDWKDSLNSLLVFAAIFAAVLTAFIIESKKLLEPDQTERLVNITMTYFNNRGNLSDAVFSLPEFEPTFTAISINCLLFASLGASLLSALISVVALQWVGDYDAAITRGGSSPEDRAKRRQFRYAGVVNWKMGEFIATLPLLLHASVALFWVGASQWMWSLYPTVGYVVATGIAVSAVVYVLTTFCATIFVSAPFRTPLSRGLYWISKPVFSSAQKLMMVLPVGSIGSWLTPISTKVSTFFDSIRTSFATSGVINKIKYHLIPHETASQREERAARDDKSLGEQTLSWLAQQLPISVDSHRRLLLVAGDLVMHTSKHELSSEFFSGPWWWILDFLGWHYLRKIIDGTLSDDDREEVRLLVKCSQVPQIKERVLAVEKPRPDSFSTSYGTWYDSALSTKNGTFLLTGDVPLIRNWETTKSEYPEFRAAVASGIGNLAEHAEFHRELRGRIPSLIEMLQDPDPNVRLTVTGTLSKLGENSGLVDDIRAIIPSLLDLLRGQDSNSSSASALTLGKFAAIAELGNAVRSILPPLLEMFKDTSPHVRSSATLAIGELGEQAALHDVVSEAVTLVVNMLKDEDQDVRSAAASTFENDQIHDSIQLLINMFKDASPFIRSTAASATGRLAQNADLHIALHDTIPPLFELVKDQYVDVRSAAASTLSKYAKHEELRTAINTDIESLIELVHKSGSDLQGSRADATILGFAKLAEHTELHDTLRIATPLLIELLKDRNFHVRSTTGRILGKLAEQAELRDLIHLVVPIIINFFRDDDPHTRYCGAAAFSQLGIQAEFYNEIRPKIPMVIEFLQDPDPEVRSGASSALERLMEQGRLDQDFGQSTPYVRSIAASTIGKLAKYNKLRNATSACIMPLIHLSNDLDPSVHSAVRLALGMFAKHCEDQDATAATIPFIIDLLKHENKNVHSTAASTIITEYRRVIGAAIPSIAECLKHPDWGVRSTAISLLESLGERAEFVNTIRTVIPSIVECFKDADSDVRSAAVSLLGKLAEFVDAIRTVIPSIVECLEDADWRAQSAANSLLGKLSKQGESRQAEFVDAIRTAIPSIAEWVRHASSHVRYTAASLLGNLAEFVDAICTVIPSIVECLKDADWQVRSAAISSLGKFAEFVDVIRKVIPPISECLKDANSYIRSVAIPTLGKLAEFVDAIRTVIPSIVVCVKDADSDVRSAAISGLVKLSEQGESRPGIVHI